LVFFLFGEGKLIDRNSMRVLVDNMFSSIGIKKPLRKCSYSV